MKTIIILIGQKGSGKTFVGTLLEQRLSVSFVRIEPIFLNIKKNRSIYDKDYIKEGFSLFEQELSNKLTNVDTVCFESTATAPEFDDLLMKLRNEYRVLLIKIDADPELCLKRVRERNELLHIPVSDDDVLRINEICRGKHYVFEAVIDNNSKSADEILDEFKNVTCFLSPNTSHSGEQNFSG